MRVKQKCIECEITTPNSIRVRSPVNILSLECCLDFILVKIHEQGKRGCEMRVVRSQRANESHASEFVIQLGPMACFTWAVKAVECNGDGVQKSFWPETLGVSTNDLGVFTVLGFRIVQKSPLNADNGFSEKDQIQII